MLNRLLFLSKTRRNPCGLRRVSLIKSAESLFESIQLFVQLLRHMIADHAIELADVLAVFLPGSNIDREQIFDGVDRDAVKTFNVDVLSLRNIADRRLNSADLVFAASRGSTSRTRMLSPKPGQMKWPSSSVRNQLTLKIFGAIRNLLAHLEPVLRSSRPCCSRTNGRIAIGSRRTTPTAPAAAAVVSEAMIEPTKTPCCQLRDW